MDEVELAADLLWAAGATAIEERAVTRGTVRLVSDPAADRSAGVTARWPGTWVDVDDSVLDLWRDWAVPARAGRRLVMHPAWQPRAATGPGDIVVTIEPGRAFGSGSHPTTRLALAALEQHVCPGDRVLDVGCGSGVLAITAALLGAGVVDAVDIDNVALIATAANASANRVAVTTGSAPRAERYDLVVANIGAAALIDLAPTIDARTVILSGILAARLDAVLGAYAPRYEVSSVAEEDGWVAPVLLAP